MRSVGIAILDVDMKRFAKKCANQYACGASVVKNVAGNEDIVIQGDVTDEVIDLMVEESDEIFPSSIEIE